MSAHFEVVRTDAEQPYHARFVGSNGEIVWTTESYADKRAADNAVSVANTIGYETRYVDERVPDTSVDLAQQRQPGEQW